MFFITKFDGKFFSVFVDATVKLTKLEEKEYTAMIELGVPHWSEQSLLHFKNAHTALLNKIDEDQLPF